MANLNLDSFVKSVEKLASQIQQNNEESKNIDKKYDEVQQDEQRTNGLLKGLSSMFNLNVTKVEETDKNEMMMVILVDKIEVQILLGDDSKVSNIQLLTAGYEWIKVNELLQEVSTIAPPNDIRQVVSHLSAAQQSPEAVLRDIAEYRQSCLIRQSGLHKVTMTLQDGIELVLEFCETYPQVPGGVTVTQLRDGSSDSQDTKLEALRAEANSQCFSTLKQLCSFIFERLPTV